MGDIDTTAMSTPDASGAQIMVWANPYMKCGACKAFVDGYDEMDNAMVPCGHIVNASSVCPSWGPVDGCSCLEHLGVINHEMRPEKANGAR